MSSASPNVIHASNGWNPTGRNLTGLPGTRLFYAHVEALSGLRTYVLLGSQQHLTFVADFEGHVEPGALRDLAIGSAGLYPHLVDVDPAAGLPHLIDPLSREARA